MYNPQFASVWSIAIFYLMPIFHPDTFGKIQPVIFKQLDTFILVVCHGTIRIINIFYIKVASVLEICTTFMTDAYSVIRYRFELVSRIFQRQIINESKGSIVFFPLTFQLVDVAIQIIGWYLHSVFPIRPYFPLSFV